MLANAIGRVVHRRSNAKIAHAPILPIARPISLSAVYSSINEPLSADCSNASASILCVVFEALACE